MDVFVRGTDGACWWAKTSDGGQHWYWTSLKGGLFTGTGPAACTVAGSNSFDVFVTGTDKKPYQKTYTEIDTGGDISSWTTAWLSRGEDGGRFTSSPSAVYTSPTSLGIFGRGSDGALWTKWWDGSKWGTWNSLKGQMPAGSNPSAIGWTPGGYSVFVRGTDGNLWQTGWISSTTQIPWTKLGKPSSGALTSSPTALKTSHNPLAATVYARDATGKIVWKFYSNGAWSTNWNGPMDGPL